MQSYRHRTEVKTSPTLSSLLLASLLGACTAAATQDAADEASADAGVPRGDDSGGQNGSSTSSQTSNTGAGSGGGQGQNGGGAVDDAGTTTGGEPTERGFGHHAEYTAGVIYPNHHSRAELDAATSAYYDVWKERYLEPACKPGQYRVHSQSATAAYTVSEAHGYGMLFTVLMHGYDSEAQDLFDGLYAYFRDHPSGQSDDLMAWAQDADCKDVMGDGSAADGDLDIAYALLLADAQWGSTSSIDYLAEGKEVIAAILAKETAAQNFVQIGSWVTTDPRADGTRSSDLIPSYFRAYNVASGEMRWSSAVDKAYALVGHIQDGVAKDSGLLPDFIVDADTDAPVPAPASWLEGAHDGHYNYNACRDPWRIGTDYLLHGEVRARDAVRKMNAFIRQVTSDDPTKIADGYDLQGKAYGGNAGPAFVGPFVVSAMIEPESGSNQSFLNAAWDHLLSKDEQTYYNDSLKLATMLVVSGNFWAP